MHCKSLFALAVAACALSAAPARADLATSGDKLLQQELRQEQIKATTQRVGAQLGAVIEEYGRNGLEGDDVVVLKAIRGVLDKLSEKEIARVVTLLQQTRATTDADASRRNALDAFAGQKTVTVQLRSLLLEYQRQQAMQEIAARFAALARRQGENLKEVIGLATLTKGRDARRSETAHTVALQLQETEQGTIGDEAKMVLAKLSKVVAGMDGPAGERPRTALTKAEDSRLAAMLDSATGDLKSANLLSAAGNEKRARDVLQDLAKLLMPARDNLEVMKQAVRDLEKAIEQQKEVKAETKEATSPRAERSDVADAERKQAEVVDKTDSIREDVEKAAPKAAEELKAAVEKQQEARAQLQEQPTRRTPQNESSATEKQEQALAKMADAKKTLELQIAKAEAQQQKPKDKLADLKELKKKVEELAAKQEQVKQNAARAEKAAAAEKKPELLAEEAAKQESVKAETQQTQQDAAANAPDAAKTLGEAVRQQEKSQQALEMKANAPLAQQAAMDALDKAAQQIDSQIAKLEKSKEDIAKLDKLSKEIGKLMQQQQKLAMDTAKAAEKPENKTAPQTAKDQGALAQQTEAAKNDAKEVSPEAASELGAAKENMQAAKANLERPDAAKARPDQAEAMANLHSAKKAVEQKMQQLANELGQPTPDNTPQLARASETVAAAQQQVNQALAKLDQPAGLEDLLKQKQQEIAAALGEKARALPQSKPVAEAKAAAEKAAEQLGKNDLKAAVGEMAKAQKGLQEASPAESKPPAGQPSLPQLAKQQADVKAMTEALAAMQATQQAALPLDSAAEMIAPLTAGEAGPLPQMAQQALQKAQQVLTQAAALANANKAQPAQANAEAAQQALAQAAAALALAQEGVGQQQAQQGQGQKGQGESQQKGKGQAKGPGESSPQANSKEGQGDGKQGNWNTEAGADGKGRGDVKGASGFLGLPARDRNAILQSQTERAPEEYSPLVEQYLKNLSDSAARGRKK